MDCLPYMLKKERFSRHLTFLIRLGRRIIFASYCIVEYLTKCLIPVKLQFFYPFPNAIGKAVPISFFIYPVILIALGFGFTTLKKQKILVFSLLFFITNTLLVLNIIDTDRQTIAADRYLYVPSIGIFLALSFLVIGLLQRFPKYRMTCLTMMCIYTFILSLYAHRRTEDWYNSNTIKEALKSLNFNLQYDKTFKNINIGDSRRWQ